MLSWYRGQINDHGAVTATWLLFRVSWSRLRTTASNRFLPGKLECPCCGWSGNRFADYIEAGYTVQGAACPACDSHSRHRRLSLWLRRDFDLANQTGRALIFAPERALAPAWDAAQGLQKIRIDIVPDRGVDVLADIQRLPFASGIARIVWCHHVLEQVEDDRVAMSELCRVLKDEWGRLIISAGLSTREDTIEFGISDKSLSGNRRSYGRDFGDRLSESGFRVTVIEDDLSEEEHSKYGILPGELFFVCEKRQASGG